MQSVESIEFRDRDGRPCPARIHLPDVVTQRSSVVRSSGEFPSIELGDAAVEAVLKRDREMAQCRNHLALALARQFAVELCQSHGEQHQRGELGCKGLGRGHADFRACPREKTQICLTHKSALGYIADRQGVAMPE